MIKKSIWIESAYLLLMIYIIGLKVYHFFSPLSQINLYFKILRAFDIVFYLPYMLSLLQVTINALSLIPLLLYILKLPVFNQKFWQFFLMFNIIFDLTGNSYHVNELIGIYHTNPRATLIIFFSSVIPYFPKYVACWRYAFSTEKNKRQPHF